MGPKVLAWMVVLVMAGCDVEARDGDPAPDAARAGAATDAAPPAGRVPDGLYEVAWTSILGCDLEMPDHVRIETGTVSLWRTCSPQVLTFASYAWFALDTVGADTLMVDGSELYDCDGQPVGRISAWQIPPSRQFTVDVSTATCGSRFMAQLVPVHQ